MHVRDFHHAEDVIQETAKSAIDSFDRYDPSRPFVAWAIVIARQRIAEHLRKQGRRRGIPLSTDAIEALESAYVRLSEDADQRMDALRQCIAKLSERHQRVIELRYGRGMSPDKIAAVIQLSANAVNALVFRARKAIAACIDKQIGGARD